MFYVVATSRSVSSLPQRQGVIEAEHKEGEHDMNYVRKLLKLNSDTRAVTALEYGMIAALIAVVVIGGFRTLGNSLSTTLTNVGNAITSVP